MRISVTIAMRVVTAVNRTPFEYGALRRHGACHPEDQAKDPTGLKGAVREHPMKPNGYTKSREAIHSQQKPEVEPADRPMPGKHDRRDQTGKRKSHSKKHCRLFPQRLAMGRGARKGRTG